MSVFLCDLCFYVSTSNNTPTCNLLDLSVLDLLDWSLLLALFQGQQSLPSPFGAVATARNNRSTCAMEVLKARTAKLEIRKVCRTFSAGKGSWIVCATPGRLLDLICAEEREGREPLASVRILVLDEGDRTA